MAHSFTLASQPPRISSRARCNGQGGRGACLVALPGQAALEQKEQGVRQGLQIISSAGRSPQVCMHAGVPHCAPADVRVLSAALCACDSQQGAAALSLTTMYRARVGIHIGRRVSSMLEQSA